jgi:hypothetical protein
MTLGAGKLRFRFEGEVWSYRAPGLTFFVSLPKEMSAEILDIVGNDLNPWGTVPVEATIGDYTWGSAMFPRKNRACYDLPLNTKTRKRIALNDGDHITVTIDIPLPA